MRDLTVHLSARGQGRIALEASAECDLTALAPLRYAPAGYLECDYTEGYAAVAHDYLT